MRVVLPAGERVPPEIMRVMTKDRRLRSAAVLVGRTSGSRTKVNSSSE